MGPHNPKICETWMSENKTKGSKHTHTHTHKTSDLCGSPKISATSTKLLQFLLWQLIERVTGIMGIYTELFSY